MPAQRRHARKQRLESAFSRAEEAIRNSGWDAALQSDLAKYLCVLLSGFVEATIEDIVVDYAIARGDQRLVKAVRGIADRFQNPKPGTLLDFLAAFDVEWRHRLEHFFSEEISRQDALLSVVDNRNRIAHGEDSGVSFYKLRDWQKTIFETVDFVEATCLT